LRNLEERSCLGGYELFYDLKLGAIYYIEQVRNMNVY